MIKEHYDYLKENTDLTELQILNCLSNKYSDEEVNSLF